MPPHPDDHVGDHPHGDQADDRLEALLLALRELIVGHPEPDRDGGAGSDRDADADPHVLERVLASLLDEEGGDDPDDQGCLEPFPEGDDQRGDQACSASCPVV
ncbi:MAG: hypothetical protein R2700_01845 [Solirubrobacterales bacterium]